jgi:hypothetical protein
MEGVNLTKAYYSIYGNVTMNLCTQLMHANKMFKIF